MGCSQVSSKKNHHPRQNEFTIQLILWNTSRKRELNPLLQCHPTPSPPRNAKRVPESANIPTGEAQCQASLLCQMPHCLPVIYPLLLYRLLEEFFKLYQPQFCVASFKASLTPPAKEMLLNLALLTFWATWFFAVRGMAVLHAIGCLAASLLSNHSDVKSIWPAATIKDGSRYSQLWGWGEAGGKDIVTTKVF